MPAGRIAEGEQVVARKVPLGKRDRLARPSKGMANMNDVLSPLVVFWVALFSLWFVLNKWVLPRFGFRT
jgi:hypothetical protein